ncbi:protein TESPA1 isoform 1-T1 [Mantella aurantiaca]
MTSLLMEHLNTSERRIAWTRLRHVVSTMDEEDTVSFNMPEFTFQDLDDAFLDEELSVDMIQGWLQGCGSSLENLSEEGLLHKKGLNSKINSLDDDFSLGAEAIQLSDHHRNRIRVLPEHPRLKTMYMGDSMTSTSTAKTSSSISEILTLYQADAENILYNLGFACDKMCSMYEIPSRFFLCPSQATGIDFKMFFESLLHRIKKGDPTYLPADHDILKDTVCTFNKLYPCRTRTLLKKPGNIGIWTYSDFLFT